MPPTIGPMTLQGNHYAPPLVPSTMGAARPPARPPGPPAVATPPAGDGRGPVPTLGLRVAYQGMGATVVAVHGDGPGAAVDLVVDVPGGESHIVAAVPHGLVDGWLAPDEHEAHLASEAQRLAKAAADPLATLPTYDPPGVGAEVVVDEGGTYRRAVVAKVYRRDRETPLDVAVVQESGPPALRREVPHSPGPGGWQHAAEVLDRRAASVAVDAGPDFEPRVGRWVRLALTGPPDVHGMIEVVPARGLIRRVTPVDLPGTGPVLQLDLTPYPMDPPADPCEPDRPLPGGDRCALPVRLDRIESVEQGHRGEWEPLAGSRIRPVAFHFTAAAMVACSVCRKRVPSARMGGTLTFEPRGGALGSTRKFTVCPECVAALSGWIPA